MKKVKTLIFTALLVVGFSSVADDASANRGPCHMFEGPCLETTSSPVNPPCGLTGPCLETN